MKIIADANAETPAITPEGAERRVLSYGDGLMAVQFTFPGPMSAPVHSHPHTQIGYVVSGSLDLIMEGKDTVRLGAGCSYYVPSGVRHGVNVLEPTVVIDAFTPVREDFLA